MFFFFFNYRWFSVCNTWTCLWRSLQEHVASFKWLIPVKFCLWGLEKIKCLVLRPWKWVYNCLLRMKTFELLRWAQLSIVCVLSPVWLFRIPWTAACWLLCPWNFPGKNTGVFPAPTPANLPDPRIEPTSPGSPALADLFFSTVSHGKPSISIISNR